jgi:hypothetical protein
MMYDLILLARHEAELRAICEEAGETEVAAYVAFGIADLDRDPWTNAPRRRLVSHQVIPIVPEEKVSASATHVTWSTRGLIRELSRLTAESLVLGIVHSHPGGAAIYSDQDDRNEAELFRAVANRNGHKAELASLLLGGDGTIACRVWHGEGFIKISSSKMPRKFYSSSPLITGGITTPQTEMLKLFGTGRLASLAPRSIERFIVLKLASSAVEALAVLWLSCLPVSASSTWPSLIPT